MRKYLEKYLKYVEKILEQDAPDTDYYALKQEHLHQIQFMQHERLVHFLVTALFGIMLFIGFIVFALKAVMSFLPVIGLMLILTIAYIRHYYFLENSVQKMYILYQRICARCGDYERIKGESTARRQTSSAPAVHKADLQDDFSSVNDLIAELQRERNKTV